MATSKLSPVEFIKNVPPGISWTDTPRGTPWTTPPKLVKVGDVAQMYIDGMSSGDALNNTLDLIETGIPLAALANATMLSGVGSNIHTIDAGILVIPVIIEMLTTIAEIHNVEYKVFEDDAGADIIPARVIKNALKKSIESEKAMEEEPKPMVELTGLMARKPSNMENV